MIASLSDLSIFLASFCLMFSKSKYHTILEHQGVLKYYFRIVLEIPPHGPIINTRKRRSCVAKYSGSMVITQSNRVIITFSMFRVLFQFYALYKA